MSAVEYLVYLLLPALLGCLIHQIGYRQGRKHQRELDASPSRHR